jgi:hypothetical protein
LPASSASLLEQPAVESAQNAAASIKYRDRMFARKVIGLV